MFTDVTEVGPWYEYSLPTTSAQYTNGRLDGKCIKFAGQYKDYGSICAGYGAKVMYKLYGADGVLQTWCSNRHVPIVYELIHYNDGTRVGKQICYNHKAQRVTASSVETGKIHGFNFEPLDILMGPGGFIVRKFYARYEYEAAKSALLGQCAFIDNCVVPQSLIWDRFDGCWETLMSGKTHDWWADFQRTTLREFGRRFRNLRCLMHMHEVGADKVPNEHKQDSMCSEVKF